MDGSEIVEVTTSIIQVRMDNWKRKKPTQDDQWGDQRLARQGCRSANNTNGAARWSGMKDYLLDAIWENQCDSYSQLLKATASAKKIRDYSIIEFDSPARPPSETKRKIRWEW